MLLRYAPAIFSVIVFVLMRFQPFLTVHTYTTCMCFDPLSMKMLSVLVWTEGLSASKFMRYKRKGISVDAALKSRSKLSFFCKVL